MNALKALLCPIPVQMQRSLSGPRVLTTPRKLNDFSQFYISSNKSYQNALREMNAGRKSSHWIWYIFPQLALHGSSEKAVYFGLRSLGEAQLYLSDPILGPRLVEISNVALTWLQGDKSITELMGSEIDSYKLLSCATVFYYASVETEHHCLFEELKTRCEEKLGKVDICEMLPTY